MVFQEREEKVASNAHQSFNQSSNSMGVRIIWCKKGVRIVWVHPSYRMHTYTQPHFAGRGLGGGGRSRRVFQTISAIGSWSRASDTRTYATRGHARRRPDRHQRAQRQQRDANSPWKVHITASNSARAAHTKAQIIQQLPSPKYSEGKEKRKKKKKKKKKKERKKRKKEEEKFRKKPSALVYRQSICDERHYQSTRTRANKTNTHKSRQCYSETRQKILQRKVTPRHKNNTPHTRRSSRSRPNFPRIPRQECRREKS